MFLAGFGVRSALQVLSPRIRTGGAAEDHGEQGLATVCMDYKEMINGRPVHIVLREKTTGTTYGVKCESKGAGDEWLVQRLVAKIDSWGLKDFNIWIKSDCEPAIRALQRAIRRARPGGVHLANSPARDPQCNGVAERAVREYMSVLRRIKLGLVWRLH